jgi:methionyl-tRNA synthetase
LRRFYVTTPIYYVNDVPHLGTAYTTIVGDALARYHRLRGHETFYLTGLDEHGLKIEQAARKAGKDPKAFVDAMAAPFREAWARVDVACDHFIRTTDDSHERVAADLWRACRDAGDIYAGKFAGLYCVGCEAYYTEKDLADGRCPVHGTPATTLEEESYFFRLSKYEKPLVDFYEAHPTFVEPEGRFNEVKSFVREGLRDLSISRTSFAWGVPVPDDPRHVMYVWFDALTNYLSATRTVAGKSEFWPADVHLVGKDILRFHAVYWPAFLMSAGIEPPRKVFAHGWLTVNGQKMSKSLMNALSPTLLCDVFGADAIRYYLLREVAFGQDGDVSYEAIVSRWNGELGNDLGNLVNRTVALCHRLVGGLVPDAAIDPEVATRIADAVTAVAGDWEALAPHRALDATWALCRFGNGYVDRKAPWALAKAGRPGELGTVLRSTLELVRAVACLAWPAIPAKAEEILRQVGDVGRPGWPDGKGALVGGTPLPAATPLFPRIDDEHKARLLARIEAATGPGPGPAPSPVTYDDFMKTDLRVGIVRTAERVPKSDKLLKLSVDVGEPEPRQIVAGIGKAVDPATLPGRRVVVVANLAPRKIFGLESRGMVLAAGGETDLQVVGFAGDVAAGTRVK